MLQCFIDSKTTLVRDAVPVGYPVDDIEVLLLNDTEQPADIYCSGEIVLRGRFIAMGYWRQGHIAAFPSEGSGQRLYRTGDLGRRLPDGSIEFIGRRDFQVKIRGYRIEPAEIENHLLQFPGVKQAVVIAQEYAGEHRLAAYVSDGLNGFCRIPVKPVNRQPTTCAVISPVSCLIIWCRQCSLYSKNCPQHPAGRSTGWRCQRRKYRMPGPDFASRAC